jgi:hypothetical protein
MKFKKYLKDLEEETTSADIATVDTKLDMSNAKKCKKHKKFNCHSCNIYQNKPN